MAHHGLGLGLLLGAAIFSTAPAFFSAASAPLPAARTVAYRFAGDGGSTARVERTARPGGGEALHGVTELRQGGACASIVEDAAVDRGGRLVTAEIAVGRCGEAPDTVLALDRARGEATVRAGGATTRFPVDAGVPWIWAPVAGADGRAASTPIAAWIALQAAGAGPVVRVIDAAAWRSFATASDQIAVGTESGTTVALGSDGIDAGSDFVDAVRLGDRGIALARVR